MPSESSTIKVVARVRPLTSDEDSQNLKVIVRTEGDKVVVTSSGSDAQFSLDGAYPSTATNAVLFQSKLESTVKRALEGYNVSVLAFGATGSGKSRLMTGVDTDPGIIPLVIDRIFQSLTEKNDKDFFITASFVDITDEDSTDLLNPHTRDMRIRHHPYKAVYMDGLSEMVVNNSGDLLRLYEEGVRTQTAGSSDLGKHRQRSSTLFTITIEQKDRKTSKIGVRSSVVLADLAGIEDSKSSTGPRALCDVLTCLGDNKNKNSHVPYRNSFLTRLLQESLGGNSFTVMIAPLSPTANDQQQTLKTLQFCQFARNIKNTVRLNIDETSKVISDLRNEISQQRNVIANSNEVSQEDVIKMEEMVKDLDVAKKQSWGEREKISQQIEQERKINLSNKGMYEWVTNSVQKGAKSLNDGVVVLQKERDQLSIQYNDKRKSVDGLKDQLQAMITDYSKFAESGKLSESETKKKVGAIHETKERLKRDSESVKKMRQQIKDLEQQILANTEAAQSRLSNLKGNTALRQKIETEERGQEEARNKSLISEELEKIKMDIDTHKTDIQMRAAEGRQYTTQEGAQLEMNVAQLKGETSVVTLQLQILRQEKQRLQTDLAALYKVHNDEIEIQQLQHFQTFREYREMFETQKQTLETRYRQLLNDAIQDAVFLSSRNTQLTQENQGLQQQISELKDRVCNLEGNKEISK